VREQYSWHLLWLSELMWNISTLRSGSRAGIVFGSTPDSLAISASDVQWHANGTDSRGRH